MKALIQRVSSANVVVDGQQVGAIEQGLLVLLGVEQHDDESVADKIVHKLLNYRVFSDDDGKMNLNVGDIGGGILLVSQFTLAAETAKGMRPGFSKAAAPEKAEQLYEYVREELRKGLWTAECGVFAADMKVSLVNDGPVTFLLEV